MLKRFASVFVLLSGCAGIAAESPTQQGVQTSQWGPPAQGLQARFEGPIQVQQNAAVKLSFRLRYDRNALPPHVDRLDAVVPDSRLRLVLVNVPKGKSFEIAPYDSSRGMFVQASGERTFPLDGSPLPSISAEFPLRAAGQELTPGEYDCTVTYSSDRGYLHFRNGIRPEGLWAGEFHTQPLRLKIMPEIAKTNTFLVPARLRVTADRKVVFLPQDAQ